MDSKTLVRRSLSHYWRTHLAVWLGVLAGTAVISGALLVGDSVRGSLKQMSLDRLGGIDFALRSHRFFREDLVTAFAESHQDAQAGQIAAVAPALLMDGGLVRNDAQGQPIERAGGVKVIAVNDKFGALSELNGNSLPSDDQIVLSHRAATQIGAKVGDSLTLWLEVPTNIPRDTLLGGSEERITQEVTLTVSKVLSETSGAGRFDLNPGQQLPLTVFVSLAKLQEELGLERVRRSKEFPQGKPARVNALFVKLANSAEATSATATNVAKSLTAKLGEHLQLSDLNLRIVTRDDRHYLSVESEQMILEDSIAEAAQKVADSLQKKTSSSLVYLANELIGADQPTGNTKSPASDPDSGLGDRYAMYSIVAGLDPEEVARPAFGGFGTVIESKTPSTSVPSPKPTKGEVVALADNEIIVNDWLAADLKVQSGGYVRLKYHLVGSHGELPEEEKVFKVRQVVALSGAGAASDRGLTPEVKGITDAKSFSDWKQPFPMKISRITGRDDTYWEEHRALPKAFVSLKVAKELWKSRYGALTSLRVAVSDQSSDKPIDSSELQAARDQFEAALLKQLDAAQLGFAVQPVKWQGLHAASGTTDFTGLFVGFSFFVIASAMVLIGLLFRLGVERRVAQLGLLAAIGFEAKQVRQLILREGFVVAFLGATCGSVAAIGYARLMIFALKSPDWWGGAIGTPFLDLHITATSLVVGLILSLVVAMGSLMFALRSLKSLSPRQLLSGVTEAESSTMDSITNSQSVDSSSSLTRRVSNSETAFTNPKRERETGNPSSDTSNASSAEHHPNAPITSRTKLSWLKERFTTLCFAFSAVMLVLGLLGAIPNSEAFSGLSWMVVSFFLVGIALFVGSLRLLSAQLQRERRAVLRGSGIVMVGRLGCRNAARNRLRSVLSTSLIASATFVIVAVAAGRRNPAVETPDRNSGNGGFVLVAESSTAIFPDLNTEAGRDKAGLRPPETEAQRQLLNDIEVHAFRMRPGENASCLNLYQTQLPTVLGVPESLLRRGGFKFIDQRKADYWQLLTAPREDGRIPVIGDMNTLMFSLHKGPGATIPLSQDGAKKPELAVVGMLDSSIFQGVLLMSEANFQRLFPEHPGYRYFLIGADADRLKRSEFNRAEEQELSNLLEGGLTSYGFDAQRVADRIAAFLIVQNTYLSTFQALGGLGLLLGTLGLATVMLRNVVERRSELALLAAVGFTPARLRVMVLAENALLLIFGLVVGTSCALIAMLPHLVTVGADTPWWSGAQLLALVFVVGMLAAWFAVREASRRNLVTSLRSL